MSSVKELKSVEITSYTIITTAIAVLFSIISSILIVIGTAIMSPNALGSSIYIISTIVVGTFMYTIYNAFCQGLLYNSLAKKLNTIRLEFKDGKELIKVSTIETAIIISMIATIQTILLYLVSIFLFPLILNSIIQSLMYNGQELVAFSLYQFLMFLSQPMTVAMIILGAFVITFVFVLLGCYIYNLLGNSGRGAIINLSKEDNFTTVDSIDVMKFTLVFGIIGGILNLLTLIVSISNGNIFNIVVNVIGGFIAAFIIAALVAIFYNFLAPKLGKLKIELVDQ